ncbi:GNAT family N-acetyltransferase [Stakelama marina]|uniref:GNAT family N-acetyltransferase n=1 Tax=Stakelama marina TaxID=2826939 RepID=UPI0024C2A3A2|nr:GNAT family N-acetyltransferase [Stakelama marina]
MRRAEAGDAAALSLVASATFLDAFAGILDGSDIVAHCAANNSQLAFDAWFTDPGSVVTLAEAGQGHAPVGYSVLTTPDLPITTSAADIELKRIYVLSRLHGSGTGRALMERALDDARALGRGRVLLGVYGENHRARTFYERHGFELAGERRFLVGKTWHEDVVYARAL